MVALGLIGLVLVSTSRPGTITAKLYGNGADIQVSLAQIPTGAVVYLFIDGTVNQTVLVDSQGAARVLTFVTPGTHQIKACLDFSGTNCTSSTSVNR